MREVDRSIEHGDADTRIAKYSSNARCWHLKRRRINSFPSGPSRTRIATDHAD
jgi:hypothetical protein